MSDLPSFKRARLTIPPVDSEARWSGQRERPVGAFCGWSVDVGTPDAGRHCPDCGIHIHYELWKHECTKAEDFGSWLDLTKMHDIPAEEEGTTPLDILADVCAKLRVVENALTARSLKDSTRGL